MSDRADGRAVSWRPSASIEVIKARAALYGAVRAFFVARGVLEVDTPVLSTAATVDRHIESFRVQGERWLQTSPEFAMKRLLCAGSGPIFQIAPAFRREEQGRHHNPEFRLLEWYRPGWDHLQLIDELGELLSALTGLDAADLQTLSYRQAFLKHAGFDPFTETLEQLRDRALGGALPGVEALAAHADRNTWLDLWMSHQVSPKLGVEAPCFLIDFPASQAALARIRPGHPPVASRFELFWHGLELANGFHELSDAAEQQQRFESDQVWRREHQHDVPPYDQNLIDALHHGLPDCAGVALGLDRLLMLQLNLDDLAQSMSFDHGRA